MGGTSPVLMAVKASAKCSARMRVSWRIIASRTLWFTASQASGAGGMCPAGAVPAAW